MRRTKEEERIKEHEDKLFAAYLSSQSEENKAAIIAYMEAHTPLMTQGWIQRLRIGAVIAQYNYNTKGWEVFVRRRDTE